MSIARNDGRPVQPDEDPLATVLQDVVDTWGEIGELEPPPLIVRERLRATLGCAELPDVERIDAGHSNPTFLVRSSEGCWILRRPPRPPFAPTAHDVLREHRILSALRDQPVRTPMPYLACDDPAVIGAPFYLMEALDGLVVRDVTPSPLDTPELRAGIAVELVDALAELHDVAPERAGLGHPGRGEAYLERQVELWATQWARNQTRPVPALEELTRRLRRNRPTSPRIAVVHGDYKLDNMLFARAAPARLTAILDWEMATLGDPLADLGYLTATWIDADEAPDRIAGLSTATMEPGYPTRRHLADRYANLTDLGLDELAWYQALALWKLAILLEASYRRFLSGTTEDAFFATLQGGVPRIAEQALDASAGALL
jgi:aminoglycoside phosphotransferase (APT) family kinase protein